MKILKTLDINSSASDSNFDAIKYFKKHKNSENFFMAFESTVALILEKYKLESVKINITDSKDETFYMNGELYLPCTLFAKPKLEALLSLLDSTIHELSHKFLDSQNKKYLAGKAEKFYQPYGFEQMVNYFNKLFIDKNLAFSIALYYYNRNANEIAVRKLTYRIMNEICEKCKIVYPYKNFNNYNYRNYVHNFEHIDEQISGMEKHIKTLITGKRLKFLFSKDHTGEDLKLFLLSLALPMDTTSQKAVVEYLCTATSQDKFAILENPNLKFTQKEWQKIKKCNTNYDFSKLENQNGKVIAGQDELSHGN